MRPLVLDAFEELFGLSERQAEMLKAVAVFVQRDDVGHGFFTVIIAAQDELEFHTHGEAPPGLNGG